MMDKCYIVPWCSTEFILVLTLHEIHLKFNLLHFLRETQHSTVVLKTTSNTYNGAFCENNEPQKKLFLQKSSINNMFDRVQNTPLNSVIFLTFF